MAEKMGLFLPSGEYTAKFGTNPIEKGRILWYHYTMDSKMLEMRTAAVLAI